MYTNAGKNGTLDYCQAALLLIIHWSILFTWLGAGLAVLTILLWIIKLVPGVV
tara:strand:- start:408 stop:566 length:159 start_codon:yes stop_codon:yes gene_type:complete